MLLSIAKPTNFGKVLAKLVAAEPKVECYCYTYTVYLDIPVKSMKHMQDALEFLERELALDFNYTFDLPASGIRQFQDQRAQWLMVQALINNDEDPTATCKRTVVGTEMVERVIYKLECSDAEQV